MLFRSDRFTETRIRRDLVGTVVSAKRGGHLFHDAKDRRYAFDGAQSYRSPPRTIVGLFTAKRYSGPGNVRAIGGRRPDVTIQGGQRTWELIKHLSRR